MSEKIKLILFWAQELIKKSAYIQRRDVAFGVGTMVYLKLKLYRQQYGSRRVCHKLTVKFYGPFEVLARVGKAAYKLKLHVSSKIHLVFHVSQLKTTWGKALEVHPSPVFIVDEVEKVLVPEDVVVKHYEKEGQFGVIGEVVCYVRVWEFMVDI